jgi:hypothetical protein
MRMALVAHIVVLAVGGGAVTAAARISAPPSLPRDAMAAPPPSEPAPTTSLRPTPEPSPSESPTPTAIVLEPADHADLDETASLPDLDLAEFQNKLLPASISDDRGLTLGSIGSGLFSVGKNEYWTITDRGPNGEPSDSVRSFPVPTFDPALVKVKMKGDRLQVVKALPLTTKSGHPVTGLPPFVRPGDPRPATTDGSASDDLLNPNGIDPEGVVVTSEGFWIVEEYGPSILRVSRSGVVRTRYVPEGTEERYEGSDVHIVGNLPSELAGRTANRGFEDVALLPDGETLIVGLQSPLAGRTESLTTKLLVFDTVDKEVQRMYNYVFDAPRTFLKEPGERAKAKNLKLSALVAISDDQVLVQERTDVESRFYAVRLADDPVLSGSDKRLIVNLAGVSGVPDKIEGVAVKDADTLVVSADNDFGFNTEGDVPATGDIPGNGVPPTFVEVKLR